MRAAVSYPLFGGAARYFIVQRVTLSVDVELLLMKTDELMIAPSRPVDGRVAPFKYLGSATSSLGARTTLLVRKQEHVARVASYATPSPLRRTVLAPSADHQPPNEEQK